MNTCRKKSFALRASGAGLMLGLAAVVSGCQSTAAGNQAGENAFVQKQELLFEARGEPTTVVDLTQTKQLPAELPATRETLDSRRPAQAGRAENQQAKRPVEHGAIAVTNVATSASSEAKPSDDREAGSRAGVSAVRLPGDLPRDPGGSNAAGSSLGEDAALEEDSPLETGELELEKMQLDAESNRSPEEIAGLVRDSTGGVEDAFVLCEGSVYMEEWARDFDTRWLAENGRNFKRRSALNRALSAARSQEFLKLLFPALAGLDLDFPVVVTDDVIKWMQYFQTRGRKWFVTALRRAEDIVPQMRPVLEAHGLPKDLVYLSMIESGFNNRALSIARAAGPWQFMRATGKVYGLKINDYVDERRDPAKATVAAAQYLTNLYTMFGDWHLATAAYNAGEGRVKRALRGAESQDYFAVSEAGRLPNETRNYVPKLIAAMIISKNPSKFGFDVTEGSRALKSRRLRIEKSVSLTELAQAIDVDPNVLENLNPELRVGITPPVALLANGFYEVRVPEQKYDTALAALDGLSEASRVQRVAAKVRKPESMSNFARRTGITLAALQKSNPGLKAGTRLRRGQTLIVPVALGSGSYDKISNEASGKSKKKVKYARNSRSLRTRSKGPSGALAAPAAVANADAPANAKRTVTRKRR